MLSPNLKIFIGKKKHASSVVFLLSISCLLRCVAAKQHRKLPFAISNMSIVMRLNDLSRPLLGLEPARDEEDARPSTTAEEEEEEEEEEPCCYMHKNTWWDAFVLWMLLPALLFAQFGIAFGVFSPSSGEPTFHHGLQWSTVKYSICLFALSAYIFRRSILESTRCCDEESSGEQILSSAFLLLWPEITMDFILFLLLFGQACPAFFVMVLCTVAQSLHVVVRSCRQLLLEDIPEEDHHDWE